MRVKGLCLLQHVKVHGPAGRAVALRVASAGPVSPLWAPHRLICVRSSSSGRPAGAKRMKSGPRRSMQRRTKRCAALRGEGPRCPMALLSCRLPLAAAGQEAV